jgi:hypothetical protein
MREADQDHHQIERVLPYDNDHPQKHLERHDQENGIEIETKTEFGVIEKARLMEHLHQTLPEVPRRSLMEIRN